MLRNQDLLDPTSRAAKLFRRRFCVPHVFFLALVRRVNEEGWFPTDEMDVLGRPCLPVTLKVSNFTQYLLNVDSRADDTAVDMNDSSVAVATTGGCCTNLLPAPRTAVYLFLYRARTFNQQQPSSFDREVL